MYADTSLKNLSCFKADHRSFNVEGAIVVSSCAGWFLFVFLAGITPLALMFLLPRIPESPRYLLIQMEDEQTARHGKITLKCTEEN